MSKILKIEIVQVQKKPARYDLCLEGNVVVYSLDQKEVKRQAKLLKEHIGLAHKDCKVSISRKPLDLK